MNFIFGGDTDLSYDQIQRRRQIAESMAPRGASRNAGEGISNAARMITGALINRKADKAEAKGRESADAIFASLMGGGSVAPTGTPFAPQPANVPPVSTGPIQDTPQAVGADTRAVLGLPQDDAASRIRAGLIERGLPEHVADGFIMNFKDESNLNAGINEIEPLVPGSRGGFGLSQWTGPRRRQLEQFAAERGVPVSDENVQMDFLMHELQGSESGAAQTIFSTRDAPSAAAAIVNDFLRPSEEHRARREAEYLGGAMPQGGAQQPQGGPSVQELMMAMQNPFMRPEQKAIISSLLGQQMQANDPLRQLQIQQAQLELQQARNPQPGFQTLSPQEVQSLGLPPGAYQRGADGKITSIGGGGVTVNNNTGGSEIGTIPQGYELFVDPETGARSMRPIPGGPEDTASKAAAAAESAAAGSVNVLEKINDVRAEVTDNPFASGLLGRIASNIPGTGAYDTERTAGTIKANLGFDRLTQMRAESPTGGALGSVSQIELDRLESTIASLDLGQSKEQILENLADIERQYTRILRNAYETGDPAQLDAAFGGRPSFLGGSEAPAGGRSNGTTSNGITWSVE